MSATYENPIIYADYSDPDAVRVGADYYMISSSFGNVPGIPVLHSTDLVSWKLINYVLKKIPGSRYSKAQHGCGVWAPAIRYHDGKYFVCFPMPDEGLYMCTAKDPAGEWSEPVQIYEGAGRIDPCPFWDDDGRAYLVSGVARSRIGYKSVLHMQEMRPDGLGLIGEPKVIFDGNENDQKTIEGPKLYKRNGYYYVFAPAGGVPTGWQTVLRSKNIFGPYEYRVVMRQGNSDTNGPHQGAWVDTVTGEDWFIHFQDVDAAGRIVHLQPMKWREDWPIIGVPKDGEEYGEPVRSFRRPDVGEHNDERGEMSTSCGENVSDRKGELRGLSVTYKSPELPWQWNANPRGGWGNFYPDHIILNAVKKTGAYGDIPNLLLRKWEAPEFTDTLRFDLSGLSDGDEAGFISMGMEYGVVSFEKCSEGFKVKSIIGKQIFGKILVEDTEERCEEIQTILKDEASVFVRYAVSRPAHKNESSDKNESELVTISFSIDGKNFTKAVEMNAVCGRWVGVKYGVFCTSATDETKGKLRVYGN